MYNHTTNITFRVLFFSLFLNIFRLLIKLLLALRSIILLRRSILYLLSGFYMTKNIIAFRKRIIVAPNDHADNRIDVATVNAELMEFGYMLTEDAFAQLAKADTSFIHNYITDVSLYLITLTGDGVWKPLHAGFPKTIMNMDICERYMHAIVHYWSDGEYYPDEELAEQGYKFETINYKMIEAATEKDFHKIFTSLVQVNQAIVPADMKTIEWFADNYTYDELKTYMPKAIPFKENLTVLAAKGLPVPVKTPTDVLRIAHYLSHGKTDLLIPSTQLWQSGWNRGLAPNPEANKAYFKTFSRPQRRYLLGLLEQVPYAKEMILRQAQWKRLGEKLHPGEYKKRYPKAFSAFNAVRKGRVKSWYSDVDKAFKNSYDIGMFKLSERPGEFARRLDNLIRKAGEKHRESVLSMFRTMAPKVSSKVLWELFEHFKKRNKNQTRYFKGKGRGRRQMEMRALDPMTQDAVDTVTELIWTIFSDKFALLKPLGNVWLDPELANIPAPTNMSTLSESLVVVVRGQRNPLGVTKNVVRCYVHWTTQDDLDLSVELCTADGKLTDVCAFHNKPKYGVYSSGDVIPGRRGLSAGKYAEYVDIVLDKTPFDYAMMTVNNYSGGSMNTVNPIVGFMERDEAETADNLTWYPATVTNSAKITSNAVNVAFVLIDLKTREWILLDEDINGIPISHGNRITSVMRRIAVAPEVSALTILKMHAEARGRIVSKVEDADIAFNFEDFSTSYEKLLEYML